MPSAFICAGMTDRLRKWIYSQNNAPAARPLSRLQRDALLTEQWLTPAYTRTGCPENCLVLERARNGQDLLCQLIPDQPWLSSQLMRLPDAVVVKLPHWKGHCADGPPPAVANTQFKDGPRRHCPKGPQPPSFQTVGRSPNGGTGPRRRPALPEPPSPDAASLGRQVVLINVLRETPACSSNWCSTLLARTVPKGMLREMRRQGLKELQRRERLSARFPGR